MKKINILFLSIFLNFLPYAQDGTLDNSFSGDGMDEVVFSRNTYASRTVIQTDGKVIVAGVTPHGSLDKTIYISRYNSDGTLDLSFNGVGSYTFNQLSTSNTSSPSKLYLQDDGKILLTFYSGYGFAIARFNVDGTLDASFGGGNGIADLTSIYYESYEDEGSDIKVLNDGKIVVVGQSKSFMWNANEEENIYIARLLSDGTFDITFSGDGYDIKTITWINTSADQVEIMSDGSLLVKAISTSSNDDKIYFLKYGIDGYLDASFASNGILTINAYIFNSCFTLYADDSFLLYTGSMSWNDVNFTFYKYTGSGVIDNTYSTNGTFSFNYDLSSYVPWNEYMSPNDIKMQQDGKMLLSSYVDDGTSVTGFLFRFNLNGSKDNTFGNNGVVEMVNSKFNSIDFQDDYKIVLAGSNNDNYSIYRLNGSCAVPTNPTSITGDNTLCLGSNKTYSVSTSYINNISAADISYVWTVPGDWTFTSSSSKDINVSPVSSGQIEVKASNVCGTSTTVAFNITVQTSVPPTPTQITGSTNVCYGTNHYYDVTPVSGVAPNNYEWWTAYGNLSGWSNTTSNDFYVYGNDTIKVRAYNTCGVSGWVSFAVNIMPVPSAPVFSSTSPTEVCPLSYNDFFLDVDQFTSSITWQYPNGWSYNFGGGNWGTLTTSRESGLLTATPINGCGVEGPSGSAYITVIPKPIITEIIGSNSLCVNNTSTYSVAILPDVNSYSWVLPNGWMGSSFTNSISVTSNTSSGSIEVTALGVCENSDPYYYLVDVVSSAPSAPTTVSGPNEVCSGSTNSYSVSSVPTAGSYSWILPNGWTGTSSTNSISSTANSSSGSIFVRAINGCGNSNTVELPITVNTVIPSTPSSIIGNTIVCTNSVNTFSTATITNASSYTWTKPAGWSGSSTTESISLTTNTAGGTITVKANNACGSSATASLVVSAVNPMPAPTSLTGDNTVCNGSSKTYTSSAVAGASTYTWTLPNGWTGTSTSTSINIIAGATDGVISVAANNECGAGNTKTLSVNAIDIPAMPGNISGDLSICRDSAVTYSISQVTDATSYTWTLPSGWNGSSTTNSIATTAGNSGAVSVTADNMCGTSAPKSITITVVDNPAHPVITKSGNTLFCDVSAFDYQWYVNGFPIPGATNQTYQINGDGNYSVVAFNSLGCFAESYFGYQVGIEENRLSSVKIIPNPSEGEFSLNFGQYLNNVKLQVIDPSGKIVSEYIKLYADKLQLNENLAKGFYFIHLKSDEGSYNQRIIIN